MNLPCPSDGEGDFGGAPSTRILTADERVIARWASALERANKGRGRPLVAASPLDVLPELIKVRALPPMPWPPAWPSLAERCDVYPGDVVGVVSGTGAGKSQWGVQAARAFTGAASGCVLWWAGEMTMVDIDLRIAANLTGSHAIDVRKNWPESRIAEALATVTDRWRFVDTVPGDSSAQIEVMDAMIEIATSIYGGPPLLVIDYVQKLLRGGEQRAAITDAMESIRAMTARRACYTIALSQTSRGNAPALAGRVEVASATDTVSAGAESSEVENVSAYRIDLNVFKADDAPILDAHWHVSKARHTGREGKIGARYNKAGGVWEELDHLPATPIEIEAEVKRSKRRANGANGANGAAPTQGEVRTQLGGSRTTDALNKRREVIVDALRRAGAGGLTARGLRQNRGAGDPRRLRATLDELAQGGRVRVVDGRWVLVN